MQSCKAQDIAQFWTTEMDYMPVAGFFNSSAQNRNLQLREGLWSYVYWAFGAIWFFCQAI